MESKVFFRICGARRAAIFFEFAAAEIGFGMKASEHNPFFGGITGRCCLPPKVLLSGLLFNVLAAAQIPGTLDPSYITTLDEIEHVQGIVTLPDGNMLIFGYVMLPNGTFVKNLCRRLKLDGTLETSPLFNLSVQPPWGLDCLAVQPDGKLVLAGRFTSINGEARNGIARLHADGTLESTATFNVGNGINAGSYKVCIALQPDGKILIGGDFTRVNDEPRAALARLLPDGTLEPLSAFTPEAMAPEDAAVHSLAVQGDGRLLVGTSNWLRRLNANGSLETVLGGVGTHSLVLSSEGNITAGGSVGVPTFPPGTYDLYGIRRVGAGAGLFLPLGNDVSRFYQVYSLALQADGKLIAGGYWSISPTYASLARLRADGSVESAAEFAGKVIDQVYAVAQSEDGKIVIGGKFTQVNDQPASNLARLLNSPATRSLAITGGGTAIQWLRGGSAPEVSLVTFERSTDFGQTWTLLGRGARIRGGWEITGLTLPAEAAIRARGRTGDGRSTGLVEQTLNVPDIAVEFPAGTNLEDGKATVDFGPATAAGVARTFTLRNPGTVPLLNLAATLTGANAGDFAVTAAPPATLAPGATADFTVTFTPGGTGARTATLQVASNDPDENPFDVALTGREATASEAWRVMYFGSPDNSGPGADLADPDADGLLNLLEFATHTHPLEWSPPPGTLVKNGTVLEFTYTRAKAALAEVDFVREFSATLSGLWSQTGSTVETILSDDGTIQVVRVNTPAGITGQRFVRLRVTRL